MSFLSASKHREGEVQKKIQPKGKKKKKGIGETEEKNMEEWLWCCKIFISIFICF